MLSEESKLKIKSFLIHELKWHDITFCICDERYIGKLYTRLFTNNCLNSDEINKLKEHLQCEKLFIKSSEKKDFPIIIWW